MQLAFQKQDLGGVILIRCSIVVGVPEEMGSPRRSNVRSPRKPTLINGGCR